MVCIYCYSNTEVSNSRSKARSPSVWRRRTCKTCVAQFTTIELPDYFSALLVNDLDNVKLCSFSRDQLFLSLFRAVGHRKNALNDATALTTTVIGRVLRKNLTVQKGVIDIKDLVVVSYEVLKRFDPLAANNYKAYHQKLLKG
jgi:transcriptional regulator NrdR family protein